MEQACRKVDMREIPQKESKGDRSCLRQWGPAVPLPLGPMSIPYILTINPPFLRLIQIGSSFFIIKWLLPEIHISSLHLLHSTFPHLPKQNDPKKHFPLASDLINAILCGSKFINNVENLRNRDSQARWRIGPKKSFKQKGSRRMGGALSGIISVF